MPKKRLDVDWNREIGKEDLKPAVKRYRGTWRIEPMAREVYRSTCPSLRTLMQGSLLSRRVSGLNYSRRSAEASAVKAYQKQGLPLAIGMEIRYVVREASKWEVDI
jgi:hypothetical protein